MGLTLLLEHRLVGENVLVLPTYSPETKPSTGDQTGQTRTEEGWRTEVKGHVRKEGTRVQAGGDLR